MPYTNPENVPYRYKGSEPFGQVKRALEALVPDTRFVVDGANNWYPSPANEVGGIHQGVEITYDPAVVEAAGVTQTQMREAAREVFNTTEFVHALRTVTFVKKELDPPKRVMVDRKRRADEMAAASVVADIRDDLESNLTSEALAHRTLLNMYARLTVPLQSSWSVLGPVAGLVDQGLDGEELIRRALIIVRDKNAEDKALVTLVINAFTS
jgi:hypothetical protein